MYSYYLHKQDRQIIQINEERQKENQEIEKTLELRRSKLEEIESAVRSQNDTLQSLITTANDMRASATEQARQEYNNAVAALQQDYINKEQQLATELQQRSNLTLDKIKIEEQKLAQLEAKQQTYLKSLQRQEEISANQDYYRLVIDSVDLDDIKLLRDLQIRFFKKDIIDKLIWETYYKPAYDILISHLITSSGKVCGIYKITDLTTGQAYIGQSVDIKERFRQHIKTSLTYGKTTNKLYSMMQKSGQQNFTFEILEEVPRAQLNEREAYWINFYGTKNYGLNSTKGNTGGQI